MKLKSPHAKGKRGEYHVRDMLRAAGFSAQRNPMSGAIEWLKGDLTTSLPFFVEVKNTEKSEFLPWYRKAQSEAQGKPVIVFWTKNNEDYYVFLKASDFLAYKTGKPIQTIPKPQKTKKLGLEETSGLPFSKAKQLRKNR